MAAGDRDMEKLRKFVAPEFVAGEGALHLAGHYARNYGGERVLVVSDAGVIAAGWTDRVMNVLRDAGLHCVLFSGVVPNPRVAEVMAGAAAYVTEKCNIIVAVGGGSVIDCAKGIGIVSANRRDIAAFEGVDRITMPSPPLICVPTTAGSAADVSQFAIISDPARKIRMAIVSKAVVPDVSLIDPRTTATMDAALTAVTGLDVLVHGIEAFVSNAHSAITDLFAREAVRLVAEHLVAAVKSPDDATARSGMMQASLYAGLAFSNAGLGLVHAMAHSIGGMFDRSHGLSNLVLLPHVIAYNFEAVPERYREIGMALGVETGHRTDAEVLAALLACISRLQEDIKMRRSLGELDVDRRAIPTMAENAINDVCTATNPRQVTLKDIGMIYEKAY